MFASMQTVSQMTCHYENRRSSGMLHHPSDGEAYESVYAHMDLTHILKHPLHVILVGQSMLPPTIFLQKCV